MTMAKRETTGYVLEVTDAENHKHYPIEGADGIGKTTIERSDSVAMHKGYQAVYLTKEDAEKHIYRIQILAEAKGANGTMSDRPILPVTVAAVPYKAHT